MGCLLVLVIPFEPIPSTGSISAVTARFYTAQFHKGTEELLDLLLGDACAYKPGIAASSGECIKQVGALWAREPGNVPGIAGPCCRRNAMETANVKNEVEWLFEEIQARNICVNEFDRETGLPLLAARKRNCLWRKIDADDLETVLGEVKRIGARPATEVERAARFSFPVLDERDDLRRSDARIPGWTPKPVHEIEENPLQHEYPSAVKVGLHTFPAMELPRLIEPIRLDAQ